MVYQPRIRFSAILAVVAFVILSVAPAAFAQNPAQQTSKPKAPAGLLRGPYAQLLRQLQGLGLTQEQRQQVLGIFKAHQPDVKALGDKVRAARARWEQAGQIDIQERKALAAERQAVMKSVTDQVFSVLTAEQQKKFSARRLRAARRLAR